MTRVPSFPLSLALSLSFWLLLACGCGRSDAWPERRVAPGDGGTGGGEPDAGAGCPAPGPPAPGAWTVVDVQGGDSRGGTVTASRDGVAHVVFEDATNLVHAEIAGDVPRVEGIGDLGAYPAVALGPDGGVHAGYFRRAGPAEYPEADYARLGLGGWSFETAAWLGLSWRTHLSIAVGSDGEPRIALWDDVPVYLRRAGGMWGGVSVDYTAAPGDDHWSNVAIALGPDDTPRVAYVPAPTFGVHLATPTDKGWLAEEIVPGPCAGVSLAFDAAGTLHLAYGRFLDPDVGLRHLVVGAASEAVTTDAQVWWTSLAIGAGGAAHVAFRSDFEPWYATNAGGAWRAEPIAERAEGIVSLALDGCDVAHVAYAVLTGGGSSQRYATNRAPAE